MYLRTIAAAGLIAASGSAALAAPVTPTFDTFGDLPEATFGGSGIPNDQVAVATADLGGDTITVGITATPRFSAPTPTNDGAGTFTVEPGTADGNPGPSLWNFSFYAEVEGNSGTAIDDLNFELLYDFDAAVGTDEADLGVYNLSNTAAIFAPGADVFEGSENLSFGFLAVDVPFFIDAPAGSFDPFEEGEYSFVLRETNSGATVAINVNVQAAVIPLPATSALLIGALGLMGAAARRRRG